MEEQKFSVSGGIGIKVIAFFVGIVNLGLPVALIGIGLSGRESIGSFIGMCVLAVITFVIFGIPTIMLIKSVLSYVKVDGECFFVREGLRTRYTANCAELKKVRCYKEKSLKGHVTVCITLSFGDKEPLTVVRGQKNFKRLAKYLYEQAAAGGISDVAISTKNRDILQRYSVGDFSCIRKNPKAVKKTEREEKQRRKPVFNPNNGNENQRQGFFEAVDSVILLAGYRNDCISGYGKSAETLF